MPDPRMPMDSPERRERASSVFDRENDPIKTNNLSEKMHDIRSKIIAIAIESKVHEKFRHTDELDRLKRLFEGMEDTHNSRARTHTFNLVGAFTSLAGAAFDSDSRVSRILSGSGGALDKTGTFFEKFSDPELKRLEGMLEEIREALRDGSRTEEQLHELLREVERSIQAAMDRMEQGFISSIRGG